MPNPQDRPAFTEPAGPLRRAGRLVCLACTSYGRSVTHYELLAAQERLPGRPFTEPERTLADARVMGRMLQRLRLEARSWPGWRTSVELLEHTRAGCRHWLVVPSTPALRGAQDVTVVGFFGDLRGGMDHSAVYDLEADVVARLGRYASAGLLSYYDAEIARGLHGNLVLFGTREVPCEWHGDVVHARAVALAPSHYRCLRLHRGIIRGAVLGQGKLVIKRTRYFDFGRQPAWRGLRRFE
jgi:hypothetical protein